MNTGAGETVFVVVTSIVTSLVCVGCAIIFVINHTVKEDSQRNLWTIAACAFTYFQILQPLSFLAVDILDTQLCSTSADTALQIPGTSSGCHIPTTEIWRGINTINFFLGQFGIVFMLVLLRNKMRPKLQRYGIALAAAATTSVGFAVLGIILYNIPHATKTTYDASALMSSPVPFSVNDSMSSCAMPDNMSSYYMCDVATNETCAEMTPAHGEGCTMFGNATSPVRPFPSNFGFVQFMLALYGALGYFIMLPLLSMGMVAYPYKLLMEFVQRPREPMPKRAFIHAVRQWSEEARQIKLAVAKIDNERLLTGTRWTMRRELHALGRQVAELEMHEAVTTPLYPQATDDPELTWTFFVLRGYLRCAWGVVAALLSLAWILNTILFVIPEPPISLWLNTTVSFSPGTGFLNYLRNISDLIFTQILTFYILKCTVVGLRDWQEMVSVFELHPYLKHGTRMSSMFFNAWPLMISTPTIIDFVATGLSTAMARTTVLSGLSSDVEHILFLRVILGKNAYSWIFLVFIAFSLVVVPWKEYHKRKPEKYQPVFKGHHHHHRNGKAQASVSAPIRNAEASGPSMSAALA